MNDDHATHKLEDEDDAATVANQPARALDGTPESVRPNIAGYEILKVLGRGGMGVVWEAIELRFDRKVAVKIHSARALKSQSDDVSQLWSEAKIAAKLGDPSIVAVHDAGSTLEGSPYYAMELVEGSDLAALISEGPLPAQRALAIAAEVARAAGAAHAQGVVHRDLKPKNVIIDTQGRARVLDFGIATHVGAKDDAFMIGSPPYMAPEQILGTNISPRTDVHAIGIVMFEMLSGARPWKADSVDSLIAAILKTSAPELREKVPGIHPDIAAVVMRCLEKDPARRFANGNSLHEALTAIIEGRSIDPHMGARSSGYVPRASTSKPPPDRPKREDATKHFTWNWSLKTPPEKLWPYVSNTDRLNKIFGLSHVDFTIEPAPQGGTQLSGKMSTLGMAIEWQEFPFEWIKNREHSVFRWYRSGPVNALWNRVKLAPSESGGTNLTHEIWILPRGLLGQVATFLEVSQKAAKNIDKAYRHLDEVLSSGRGEDPFEDAFAPREEDERHVRDALLRLAREHGFRESLAAKFAEHLLSAPTRALMRIRPFEIADAWKEDRAEVLDLALHAAHVGLLEPSWDTICPRCMLAHDSVMSLAQVTSVGHCAACASSYTRDLANSVELVFRPHPRIRPTTRETYCAGAPALRPHVLAQQVLYSGETRTITLEIPRGSYRVSSAANAEPWEVGASAVGYESNLEINVANGHVHGRPGIIRAGEVKLTLRNDTEHDHTLRIEIPGAREDGVPATSAMTNPTFRELFGEDLLAHGEHLSVSHMAFLFASVGMRSELFRERGDAAACEAFARLDAVVASAVKAEEGTLVPASLDLIVAAFASAPRALRAANTLLRAARDAGISESAQIACHEGKCIALTRHARTEYFGETLHRGAALLQDAHAGSIALSATMSANREVASLAHDLGFVARAKESTFGPYKGRRIVVLRITE